MAGIDGLSYCLEVSILIQDEKKKKIHKFISYNFPMDLWQCVVISFIMTVVSYTFFLMYMLSSPEVDEFWCNLIILTFLLAGMMTTTINLIQQCERYSTYNPVMVV